jgi:acyl phosphate:glycerol-3-phosphate acyltransferase
MMTVGALAAAYLVGSVPSGYLLLRAVKGIDVRAYGSHNVGAINVARAGGIWLGLATLAADAGKALAVVVVSWSLGLSTADVAAAALLVMVGHAYSVWFLLRDGHFAEGKSVACGLGVLVGLAVIGVLPWALALAPLGLWVLGLLAPRLLTGRWNRISPVTMLATVSIPLVVGAAHPPVSYLYLSLTMAALILVRHKNNIRRLLAGTEPRLGERRAERVVDNPGPRAGWTSRLGTEGGRR